MALLVGFHFWFVNHVEELIGDLVKSRSNGRLELKIEKFKFNWFSKDFELRKVIFNSTDSVTANTSYHLDVSKIKLRVKEMWPLIFDKRFLIDSLVVIDPVITITRLRASPDSLSTDTTNVSLPQEMGRVYNSIQDALKVLQVDRFQIDNGAFNLVNRIRPQDHRISISRINFKLDNLVVDTAQSKGDEKIFFSDNVSLQTSQQDIMFPDGRHRIAFKNFHINILNRVAEFDSCTISATKEDSSNNSFTIFFDKLRMTNIDFDTLYHTEVIKADSVYCFNPKFRLDIDLQKREGPVKPPKLDELIQQLTGDLQLAFVVVQDGSFDINTMREGRPSSFTSNHNNFDLQGLRIQQTARRKLTIEKFAMAIRNYENFLRDSAYAIQFDSILINNNRISLSNFTYQELDNGRVMNSLQMPQFELHGLSWDDLIFEQQLKAERINLYSPVIDYTIKDNKNKGSQDMFQALAGLGNILQLENLKIRNGQINLLFNNDTRLQLSDAYVSVSGQRLVNSKKITTIQRSVNELYFKRGSFKSGSLTATLNNAVFREGGQGLSAASIHLQNRKNLTIDASQFKVRHIAIDEQTHRNVIDGISWEKADVQIIGKPAAARKSMTGIDLNDIQGRNTKVTVKDGDRNINVMLNTLGADHIGTAKGKLISIDGMRTNGQQLHLLRDGKLLNIEKFNLADKQSSAITNFSYTNNTNGDSIDIKAPVVTVQPDLNQLLKGFNSSPVITVERPTIRILLRERNQEAAPAADLRPLHFEKLLMKQPMLSFTQYTPKGLSTVEWDGTADGNFIEVDGLNRGRSLTDPVEENKPTPGNLSIRQISLSVGSFIFTDPRGKKFDAGNGIVNAQLNDISFQKNENENWDWQGTVTDLYARNFILDSLGKRRGRLDLKTARLSDLAISSATLINMRDMVSVNTGFRLKEVTGTYDDSASHYNWGNLAYDKRSRVVSVDTFSFHPTLSREDYVKNLQYQADYIHYKTGPVTIGPFDINRFIQDTVLDLGTVNIERGYLSSYRDKRISRRPGDTTLLPTRMIRRIPLNLVVDSVLINDSHVDYEEVNEKNDQTGLVEVRDLNGYVSHLRNHDLKMTDSLAIHASAFVAGALPTTLDVRAAYLDTAGGFVMKVQIGESDLTKMNPVLRPLASAELKSGHLDTLSMEVRGREHHAFGDMTMYYHDLKIRVVRIGPKKTNFFTGVLSFLANTLVKNENKSRKGTVYFKRFKDRSAINYLVKITMNGVVSSIGLKKNKKQVKRYKEENKRMKLPFFAADPV